MRKAIVIGVVAAVAAAAVAALAWWGVAARQGSRAAEVTAVWGARDSRELEVAFGPCSMGWSAGASETADVVTVWVELAEPIQRGQDCTAEAAIVTLPLTAPLGDRRVVDEATGNTLTVYGRDAEGPSWG